MSFSQRLTKAQEAADAFRETLRRFEVPYAECGYENLPSEFNFKQEITRMTDGTSTRIRFWPDFIALVKHAWLFEIKHSSGIERDAFEAYTTLESIGYNVVLAFWREGAFLVCRPDELTFERPNPTVYGMTIPIVDEVWRTPRDLPAVEYHEYLRRAKEKNQNTSGCAFAFVDFGRTPFKELEAVLAAFMAREVAA